MRRRDEERFLKGYVLQVFAEHPLSAIEPAGCEHVARCGCGWTSPPSESPQSAATLYGIHQTGV